MLVVFGSGKCPVCGDFGRELKAKVMHCGKCNVAFDDFMIAGNIEIENMVNGKYWN